MGHFKIKSPDDLDRYAYWVVEDFDSDDQIDHFTIGKDANGAKLNSSGTDGSSSAATRSKELNADLLKGRTIDGVNGWWGEFSKKLAYAMLKRGASTLQDPQTIERMLGKDIEWHGEHPDPNAPPLFKKAYGWCTREIGGHRETKIILGNPKI